MTAPGRHRLGFEAGLRRAMQVVADGAARWRAPPLLPRATGDAEKEREAIMCAAGWVNDEIRRIGAEPEPVDVIAENARLRAAAEDFARRVDVAKLAELAAELFSATEAAEEAARTRRGAPLESDGYVAGYLETTTRNVATRMLDALGRHDEAHALRAKQAETVRAAVKHVTNAIKEGKTV